MRVALALTLTLTLTTSSVAHAGWPQAERAALKEIVDLENAGKLAEAVSRAEQEFARVEAPAGFRRAVAKRGKAAALTLFGRTTDTTTRNMYLCTALTMLRTYAAELAQSEPDRTEIPAEVEKLEAQAVAANAPCALAAAPEPATLASQPAARPAETPAGSPEQPAKLASSPVTIPKATMMLVPPPTRRSRGQITAGAVLTTTGAGLAAGWIGCFAAARDARAEIAGLDAQATAQGRDLTSDELAAATAADLRGVRLHNTGTALGVFSALGVLAGIITLALPPRRPTRAHARPVGASIRINF